MLNPYNADITPSGSSSGSGAAAAAGLAAITIGTETSGSIVSPAAAQSIVGLRPTIGLVSRTGILPISATQDTAGPMTRTVADAAAELGAIAGKDPEDPATDAAPATVPDYLAGADHALAGQADRRHQQHQRAVRRGDRGGPGARRDDGHGDRRRRAEQPLDILTPEFKRDLNGVPQPPARERADEDARGRHRLQQRARRRRARSTARRSCSPSQATDLTDPAQNAAYVTTRDNGRRAAQQAIDNAPR